jgi:hypothetical protein
LINVGDSKGATVTVVAHEQSEENAETENQESIKEE